MEKCQHLNRLAARFNKEEFEELHEEISFAEYLDRVYANPLLVRTAYQRLYDMIMSEGCNEFQRYKKKLVHYNFFDDPEIPIFGLEETLDELVKFFKGAAGGYGTEKRVLLLHGPVGSSKSTILRRIKRGLEKYSRKPEGSWYSFKWVNLPTGATGIYTHVENECPMHEEPLKLIPITFRKKVVQELNEVLRDQTVDDKKNLIYSLICDGELDPRCRKFMEELMRINKGNWQKIVEDHIRVIRKVYSEADRCGIATFQPKDEKNQDATELTGDIAFDKIGHFGADSDPRAFNFDGEFCVGNRGIVEFIEMLKLAQEFLYDLLGASQERQIKPKKFPQIAIDEAIIGHTNNPEYERLRNNQYMEALKDRTVKIDVPYLLRWSDEIKVLEQDYGGGKVRQHVAPHTLEIAALWAILTRLDDDKDGKLTLVQKVRLYNGEALPGYTEDTVKELHDKHPNEGMTMGVSARYVQDKVSNCLSNNHDYINPFMVLHEIKSGLDNNALINKKEDVARYNSCVDLAVKELDEILKDEVRKALVGDEKVIERLCANYIECIMAYIRKSKIKNKLTGRDEPPNERLMRSIEEKIGIPDQGVDDFRRMIAAFIGDLATDGKRFKWDSNPDLRKALEARLFEDTRDHIKLSALNVSEATVVAPDVQDKIDAIKKRLIDNYGYNDKSASDVLDYVGSLFARTAMDEDDK
jgi:serine protein kinase